MKLSSEQQLILKSATPPSCTKGKLVRITAAAGTGKTTTLLQLAQHCASLGHAHITYVTFNKSAAADGERRIRHALQQQQQQLHRTITTVEARTLHASAMQCLGRGRRQQFLSDDNHSSMKWLNDNGMKQLIRDICDDSIQVFLQRAYDEIRHMCSSRNTNNNNHNNNNRQRQLSARAYDKVVFFIQKTLIEFCRSKCTLEEFQNPREAFLRNYFPAVKYHQGNNGPEDGFPRSHYESRIGFYADEACRVWHAFEQRRVKTFDLEMKRAQLQALRIPGTLLLVDECQDMDGCQVDWVAGQVKYGTHVYFVGDAAQTIYSFRGARSKYMMDLCHKNVMDYNLTTSWRFGHAIARVANTVLFAKEKSPQTTSSKTPTWKPYRVTGGGRGPCAVTNEVLLPHWRTIKPVTVLARTNATLMLEAVKMMGMNVAAQASDDGNGNDETSIGKKIQRFITPDLENDDQQEGLHLPKFHINGRGENSGLRKWKQVVKEIEYFYDLFICGEDGMVLPQDQFPEWHGRMVNWERVVKDVQERELTKYMASLHVVSAFKHGTKDAMKLFQQQVIDKAYESHEADVILTTCHAAKGMEWDNVQVCNDFVDMAQVKKGGPQVPEVSSSTAHQPLSASNNVSNPPITRLSWQFTFQNFGDDVNLVYVACTRAKRILCIPETLKMLLEYCDTLHDAVNTKKRKRECCSEETKQDSSGVIVFGHTKPLSDTDMNQLYQDICIPLRQETGIKHHERFVEAFVRPLTEALDGDDDDDEVIVIEDAGSPSPKQIHNEVIVIDTPPPAHQTNERHVIVID